ncbi:hypothetical protein Tco_0899722, partial [Tanacetum coccineum]
QVHIENQFHVQHLVQVFKSLWQLSMLRCSDELRIRASLLYRTSNGDVKHYIVITYFVSLEKPSHLANIAAPLVSSGEPSSLVKSPLLNV